MTYGKQHIYFWKIFHDGNSPTRLLRDKLSGTFVVSECHGVSLINSRSPTKQSKNRHSFTRYMGMYGWSGKGDRFGMRLLHRVIIIFKFMCSYGKNWVRNGTKSIK